MLFRRRHSIPNEKRPFQHFLGKIASFGLLLLQMRCHRGPAGSGKVGGGRGRSGKVGEGRGRSGKCVETGSGKGRGRSGKVGEHKGDEPLANAHAEAPFSPENCPNNCFALNSLENAKKMANLGPCQKL